MTGNDSHPLPQELGTAPWEESTNDISHYLGMLDPWYERNVLGLMHLPPEVLCQVSPWPLGRGRGPTGCITELCSKALVWGIYLRPPWRTRAHLETSREGGWKARLSLNPGLGSLL